MPEQGLREAGSHNRYSFQSMSESRGGMNYPDVKDKESILQWLLNPVNHILEASRHGGPNQGLGYTGAATTGWLCLLASKHNPALEASLS